MNSSTNRSALVALAVIVVVTLLIWAGVHNARERHLEIQRDTAAKAVLVPDAVARTAADGPAPKLQGQPAPAFTLVDLSGKKVSLADFKGKPVLVNFWATWCGPCQLEMPWFEEFSKKYADQNLVILGVSMDDAPKTTVEKSVKKVGVTYPILLKDDTIETAYGGVELLPETFYVGKDGKVVLDTAGLTSEEGGKSQIEANIKKLLAAGGQ